MTKLRLPLFLLLLPLLFVPFALFAADTSSGLVVCGNGPGAAQCTFADAVNEVKVIINFLLFKIAAPLAAVMFAYAGFLYVTNGGNESKIKEAHEIFWNVFIGLVIALSAWLLVNFILTFFLGEGSKFNFLG